MLSELSDVLRKKFGYSVRMANAVIKQVRKNFQTVSPEESINILKDTPDNRVLETAIEGNCEVIITGDKDMLKLGTYKRIRIITAEEFIIMTEN